MRPTLRALMVLTALLAATGCSRWSGGGTGDLEAAAVAAPETPRPRARPDAATGGASASAQAEADAPDSPDPTQPAAAPSRSELACIKRGGSFQTVGRSQVKACIQPTRDGGEQCRKETDCEGRCLARSGTCAPFTPLFGCNEILQKDGRRVTLCID